MDVCLKIENKADPFCAALFFASVVKSERHGGVYLLFLWKLHRIVRIFPYNSRQFYWYVQMHISNYFPHCDYEHGYRQSM